MNELMVMKDAANDEIREQYTNEGPKLKQKIQNP